MNILVLETDAREIAALQEVLNDGGNVVMPVHSSADALRSIQAGTVQMLIANQDTTDIGYSQLVQHIRSLPQQDSVYTLLITSRILDDDLASNMDDVLHRPYTHAELRNRIEIAERIITLTSQLAKVHEQLESQAAFDTLTGFLNRMGFLRQSVGELERSRRASAPLSMIALDIDNFKLINDKFGGQIGDEVIEAVAKSIREKSRPYDCIGRWTGDEFVIVLPGVIGADAEKVAERIIAGVRGTRIEVQNEAPLTVKISAGIASIMRITPATEVEPIIQNAREAVTRAKEAGGDQVFVIFI